MPPSEAPLVSSRKGLLLLGAAVIGLLLCWRAQFSLVLVKGESMHPGLSSGDLLLVDKLPYRAAEPERGDIVVARHATDLIVKRLVALPGEQVELRRGKLYVNGFRSAEDYPVERGTLILGKGRLFENRYALLGDNRSLPNSLSVHAVVSKDQILGKVVRSLRFQPRQPKTLHTSL
jgi:signal peptidase I